MLVGFHIGQGAGRSPGSINFFYSAPPPAPQHCLPRGGFLRLQTVLLISSQYIVSSMRGEGERPMRVGSIYSGQ